MKLPCHKGDDSLNKSRLIITLLPLSKGEEEGEFFGDSFCAASVMADNLCWRCRLPIFIFRCLRVSNWVYKRRNSSYIKEKGAEVLKKCLKNKGTTLKRAIKQAFYAKRINFKYVLLVITIFSCLLVCLFLANFRTPSHLGGLCNCSSWRCWNMNFPGWRNVWHWKSAWSFYSAW